jgi:hypothetical protein
MIGIVIGFIIVAFFARLYVGYYLVKHDEDYIEDNSIVRAIIEWINKIVSKKK